MLNFLIRTNFYLCVSIFFGGVINTNAFTLANGTNRVVVNNLGEAGMVGLNIGSFTSGLGKTNEEVRS